MGKQCKICKLSTMFYYWSTGRDFPVEKLLEFTNMSAEELANGCTVCFRCSKQFLEYPKGKQ